VQIPTFLRLFRSSILAKSRFTAKPNLSANYFYGSASQDLDSAAFQHVGGHCWRCEVSAGTFPNTDDTVDPKRSWLVLSENDTDIGPAHEAHDMIIQYGRGRYSHWQHMLYFSASDNSDPTTNGRRYQIRSDPHQYFLDLANYALVIVDGWCGKLSGGIETLRGKRVLEIGPGRSMGTIVAMAALGAEVLAADRFCGDWQEGWHDGYIPALCEAMTKRGWPFDQTIPDRILDKRTFVQKNIHVERRPFEALEQYEGFADFSFSHSTFEHFYDFPSAAASLTRISKHGAVGVHDVDFRDHKNFGFPLEFLLLPDDEYARDDVNDLYARGNRLRPHEIHKALEQVGFKDISFAPYATATDEYLDEFILKLDQTTASKRLTREQLCALAGSFVFVKA
jgi:hypothetical protein